MKFTVINGVNLNRLGKRDEAVYGTETLEEINNQLKILYPKIEFDFKTSNSEGDLVTAIQNANEEIYTEDGQRLAPSDGILINAGAYSHYSIAIRDAIADCRIPVVEVHLSNIFAREVFRRTSVISPVAAGVITGFGKDSYIMGVAGLMNVIERKQKEAAEAAKAPKETQSEDGETL